MLVLEFIQFISFILPAGSSSYRSDSLFLATLLDYVEFTHFFLEDSFFLLGYYIAVGILVVYSLSFFLFFFLHTGAEDHIENEDDKAESNTQPSSFFITYIGKPLSIIAILHREFLLIPTSILLLLIFYNTITTDEGVDITITNHVVLQGVSGLLLFFSLLLAIMSSIFFMDTQPDSTLPWANCNSGIVLLKLLKKIIIIACTVLSFKISSLYLVMLILLNIVNCFSIVRLSEHLYMNDFIVHGFLLCSEGGVAWLCIICLLQRLLSFGASHDVCALLAIPVSFFLLRGFVKIKSQDLIHTNKVEYLPDENAMEQYVLILCRIFQGQSRCENYITLQGVFSSHIRSCTATACPCEDISRALEPGGQEENLSASTSVMKSVRAISIKQTIQRNLSIHSADIPLNDYNSINNKKFFEFMRSLLERAIMTVAKSTRLYIQLGYIHFLSLENKFIALYNLMNAQDSKPSLFEEFLIFRLKNRIEEELKVEEERYSRVGNLTLHINQQITFQQNFADFQSKMSQSLEFYISFWKELMEETPNFIYLNKLGYEIAKESARIRSMYKKLAKANPNNIQCKMIYALFLRKIEKDEFEAFEICEQVQEAKNNQRIKRNYESVKDEKYGANSKAAIILISGNKSNLGEVLNANNELSEILGYDKKDIIGTSISKIMPSAIGHKHNELIKEYFHQKGSVKQGSGTDSEKIVFAIDRYGHIVACTLFHKLVPNLVKGIQLIGFIFLADDISCIRPGEEKVKPEFLATVLTDSSWAIHGFNNKFARLFKIDLATVDIKRYLNAEEKLNIGKFISEIEDNDNLGKMKSEEGFVLDLDVEKVSREIEAEIDAIHPPATEIEEKKSEIEDSSDFSASKDFHMESLSGPNRNRIKTVNVKCVDQDYGKNSITKDFLFSLRILSFRIHSSVLSGFIQLTDPTPAHRIGGGRMEDKDMFSRFLEERQSQSQTSSHASVIKIHGRVVKDFKSKMHTMQEPVVLKWLYRVGVIIFLALLSLSITQLVLKKQEVSTCKSKMELVKNSATRMNKLNNVCLFSRTLFEVYRECESKKSDLIPDRISYYMSALEKDLESLREIHNVLTHVDHHFSDPHTDLLTNSANLKIWEMADSGVTGDKYRYSNIAFNVAITNFVARVTDISGLSSQLRSGYTALQSNATVQEEINRLEYYIMQNGRGTLRSIAEKSAQLFLNEAIDSFKKNRTLHYAISSLGTGCVLLVVIFFVPYIMKVQRNILKVFDHMSDIKQEEIQKILDMCYIFKEEIEAPIVRLKSIYDKEDFTMTTDEIRKEEQKHKKAEEKRIQKHKMLKKLATKKEDSKPDEEEEGLKKSDEDSEGSKSPVKEREIQYKMITDERRTFAKKKLFSIITSAKRKGYIIRLAVFFIFFATFLIVDVFLLKSFFSNCLDAYDYLGLYTKRDTFFMTALLFYRENLVAFEKLDGNYDILSSYLEQSFQNEKEVQTITNHLSGYFEPMKEYIGKLESNSSCGYYTVSSSDYSLCQSVFDSFMQHGLSLSIMQILREMQNSNIILSGDLTNRDLWMAKRNSTEVVEVNDITAYFLDRALTGTINQYMSIYQDFLDSIENDDNIKFSVFVVFLILISVIIWVNMLNSLNTDILRAKGVFNILPTYLLNENTEFIKDISNASIFTQ